MPIPRLGTKEMRSLESEFIRAGCSERYTFGLLLSELNKNDPEECASQKQIMDSGIYKMTAFYDQIESSATLLPYKAPEKE